MSKIKLLSNSVPDPDPNPDPDPPDPLFLGHKDPDPDPLVRGMDPDPAPGPSIIKLKFKIVRKTLISTVLWLLFDFLSLKTDVKVPLKSTMQKNFFF